MKNKKSATARATKLRVGVIGVGYLGRFHAQKYGGMPDVELVGVVDSDPHRAGQVAGENRTAAFADHQALFGKVDAVSIAASTPAHFSIARDFLQQDIDVLIEKPIASTIEDADELIRIAESRGLIMQVGHLERFNPVIMGLEGKIHSPRFIESHRLSIFQGRCTDVSVVLDLMIHDIDLILNLVHADLKEVRAAGISVISGHVDIANARLEFANGAVANVTASRISAKNERKLRLFQNEGYLSIDFANHIVTAIHPSGNGGDGIIPGMEISRQTFEKGDALNAELRSFVQCVNQRTPPLVTGRMGRDALKTALSIMTQIQETGSHQVC